MKNLRYIPTNEWRNFENISNSKKRETRDVLSLLSDRIKNKYEFYLENFENISLLEENDFNELESSCLLNCYKVSTNERNKLIKSIIDQQTVQFQSVCGYCLINTRATIDHYVPEESYPVYSVLAKNLLPCCDLCNKKKGEYWRNEGSRTILHLYNDFFFEFQFLFGVLLFDERNVPLISFELRNDFDLPEAQFSIIKNHFDRLDLLNRYSANINLVISDVVTDIISNRFGVEGITNRQISNIILNKSRIYKDNYGLNYWKSIVYDLLANSERFLNLV